ncbi:hypothetical protein EJ104_04375 [Deinococcus radiophilus]|uniref:Magnesium chelatase ChlI-like catalytic domain-containing protein n=1 Tax=Deinococcus radiophilus TaxID=32062 RepID=A0A431W153_9DEIO|nr:hypothetical protein EJ104_04375 [Deinococcus radiophilus]
MRSFRPTPFSIVYFDYSVHGCPCGHLGDPEKACTCTPAQRTRYLARLSGPLLDRIDLVTQVPRLTVDELTRAPVTESSDHVNKNANCDSYKLGETEVRRAA